MKMAELSNNLELQITDANEVPLDILDKLYITFRIRFLMFEATNTTIHTRTWDRSPIEQANKEDESTPVS